jgi:hypothetical protein
MTRRIAIVCLALVLAGISFEARAELVIYAQDTSLNSGGYGLLNIYLSGTPVDAFDTYQVTLSITPNPGSSGTVIFAPNGAAPDPANAASGEQPYNYLAASNYLFSGDSLDGIAGVNGGGYPSGYAYTYFSVTDMSLSGSEYESSSDNPPTSSSPGTLLASVLVYAESTNPGDTYSVNLVYNNSGGYGDTFFTNNGTDVSYSPSLGSSSGFTGTISISSVPEPASVVSGLTGLVLIAGFRRVRRISRSRRASA